MQRISGYHYVINGCNRDNPSGIKEAHQSEQHVVQCCDDFSTRCKQTGCPLKADYASAVRKCAEIGLGLCKRTEELNYICCGDVIGCQLSAVTMWIADDLPPHGTHALNKFGTK